jgi:predicted kinase
METDFPVLLRVKSLEESLGTLPEQVTRPAFIVLSGLPGSGKSYFSKRLAGKIPIVILESDALRKALYPSPTYSPRESGFLFEAIHVLVDRLLREGYSVILDATNLSERNREILYRIADRNHARLIVVYLEAPPELIRARLEERQMNPDAVSDADWAVYEKMLGSVEKINRRHYIVNTAHDITPAIEMIVKEVTE